MRIDQNRRSVLRLVAEEIANLAPPNRIDTVRRFVEQQNIRRVKQSCCEAEALGHSFGEFFHAHIDPLGDAQFFEKLAAPPIDRRGVEPRHSPEDRQRLPGGQVSRNLVTFRQVADPAPALRIIHWQTCDLRGPVGGPRKTQKDLHRGRFSCAVGPQKTEELASADGEIDAVERRDSSTGHRRPINLAQTMDFDSRAIHLVNLYVDKRHKLRRMPADPFGFCIIAYFGSLCQTQQSSSIRPGAAGPGSSAWEHFSACLRS